MLDVVFYWALFSFFLPGEVYADPTLVPAKAGNCFVIGYCNCVFFFATTVIEP